MNIKGLGNDKPCRVVMFDSVAEFTEMKDDIPNCKMIWDHKVMNNFSGGGHAMEWFGCGSKKEFFEILHHGHPKYIDMIQKVEVDVLPPKSLKRRRKMGAFGDELDIHRIYAGDFARSWSMRDKKVKISYKNIRLITHNSTNCGVDADSRAWIGVTVLKIAEVLIEAGYNVAIDAIDLTRNASNEENYFCKVTVKDYESPLDLQQLSSFICFSGFFRGPGFMNMGYCQGKIDSYLGQCADAKETEKIMPKFYTETEEAVEFIGNNVLTLAKSTEEIKRVLHKYGHYDDRLAA